MNLKQLWPFKRDPADKPVAAPEPVMKGGALIIRVADGLVLFACVGVIVVAYILDAIFFASTGGAFWLVFMLVGLVFRSFAVGTGVVLTVLRGVKWVRDSRRTLRAVQLACAIACLYPPVNFFAASHFEKASQAEAVTGASTASTNSKESRIERLEKRRTDALETRNTSMQSAKDAMAIIKDQVVGTSTADNQTLQKLQDDITGYIDAYSVTEKEISAEITAIEKEREVVQTEAAADTALTFHTWPVFIWLGEQFPLTKIGPDGVRLPGSDLIWANWSLFYFAMLVEFCALLALGAYLRIHNGIHIALAEMATTEEPAKANEPATPESDDPADNTTAGRPGARKGGQSTQHTRDIKKNPLKVPVTDDRAEDGEMFEPGIAAQ